RAFLIDSGSFSNKDFANGEMLSSLHCGLRAMVNPAQAGLIGLGDQPQIQEEVVRRVCEAYREKKSPLIVPSFQMRRGHPWLVDHSFWNELLRMNPPESPRDFLNRHANEIHYVEVDMPSILADLDTPDDYQKSRP
ncbi:MAG TPA: NTP transferase domain-containing protein, partial [Anaerolineales bacterium]|nr:NTP transferase domain-containing protein [Anaerolineales bacterium]